jgi:hypothetical protein
MFGCASWCSQSAHTKVVVPGVDIDTRIGVLQAGQTGRLEVIPVSGKYPRWPSLTNDNPRKTDNDTSGVVRSYQQPRWSRPERKKGPGFCRGLVSHLAVLLLAALTALLAALLSTLPRVLSLLTALAALLAALATLLSALVVLVVRHFVFPPLQMCA